MPSPPQDAPPVAHTHVRAQPARTTSPFMSSGLVVATIRKSGRSITGMILRRCGFQRVYHTSAARHLVHSCPRCQTNQPLLSSNIPNHPACLPGCRWRLRKPPGSTDSLPRFPICNENDNDEEGGGWRGETRQRARKIRLSGQDRDRRVNVVTVRRLFKGRQKTTYKRRRFFSSIVPMSIARSSQHAEQASLCPRYPTSVPSRSIETATVIRSQ